ncbi:MAG: HAMP domain-containing sensor histidine kinase [Solirubrobacterales bacterium]
MHPRSWPVRWRLAAVSSGLTLVILVVFGGAVGKIATQRIRDDFNNEVRNAVQILASETKIDYNLFNEGHISKSPQLKTFALPDDASVRVYGVDGQPLGTNERTAAGEGNFEALGPLLPGIRDYNGIRVATEAILGENEELQGIVQYGRSTHHVEETVDRVWLLIAAGILGGTILASLAGVAIASRAMRPIASLTSAARRIATTRDPSLQMPKPPVEDEVGELALTLEQMLRSLDAARSEREEAMQRQREFVADASHELRTPLTSVLANLELLQASLGAPSQEEDREIVDSALRSSRRMSRLVADLLLLARADAGRLDQHRPCDLAEIAGEAAVEAAPLMGERVLTVENERALPVEGSPDELHRMILNLLENAARYTPPDAHIDLTLRREGGDAVVEVADDGPGIPIGMRTQIFGRFVRGQGPADTHSGTGTGLGLAIVSAVAASHGGSVVAEESALGGALFRARIPAKRAEKPEPNHLEAL